MKRKSRHHFPCRCCGASHTNPSSSSVCNGCGPLEAIRNLENKEAIRLLEEEACNER
jgi:ribosomal protein L37E